MLVFGPLAPFFWIEIIGCIVAAVICLVPSLRKTPLLVLAALLSIAAIFCKRVQLLVGGFQIVNLDMAGPLTSMHLLDPSVGLSSATSAMVYWPTGIEFGVALGVVALGFLVFFLGAKFLPLESQE